MTTNRNDGQEKGDPSNKGKNLGQGLAGLRDDQRRDLVGSGDDTPTKDQRGLPASGQQGGRGSTGSAGNDERR